MAVRASSSRNSTDVGHLKWASRSRQCSMSSASVAVAAGAQHDERLDRLAPLLVGHADDRGLGDGRVLEEAVLDLDRADVLAAGDDHVLLAVGDHDVRAVEVAAVAGVEPAVDDRLGRLLGLLPVALEHVVGAGEHLALVVDPDAHADGGHAGAAEALGPLGGRRARPTPRGARFMVRSGDVSVRP